MLRIQIAPWLRTRGFKGSRNGYVWHRENGWVASLQFQRNRRSTRNQVRFDVNVAVLHGPTLDQYWAEVEKARVLEKQPEAPSRAGNFTPHVCRRCPLLRPVYDQSCAVGPAGVTPTVSNACQTSSNEVSRGVTAQSLVVRPLNPWRRMQSRLRMKEPPHPMRSRHIVASDALIKFPEMNPSPRPMVTSMPPPWTTSRARPRLFNVLQPNPSAPDARILTSALVANRTG